MAAGLQVYAPDQKSPEQVPFSFGACAHQGVLSVEPMRAGVGVPAYTSS